MVPNWWHMCSFFCVPSVLIILLRASGKTPAITTRMRFFVRGIEWNKEVVMNKLMIAVLAVAALGVAACNDESEKKSGDADGGAGMKTEKMDKAAGSSSGNGMHPSAGRYVDGP